MKYYPYKKETFKEHIDEGSGETFLYIEIDRFPIGYEKLIERIENEKSSENLDKTVLKLVEGGYAYPVYALRGC
ncbi:MAG: hypothetical protein J7L45_00440 [Candidatus Aenigmarchaeota archaeon]|nr:hypothetical protein [Candidatus Aenigmarchaeota archaeon]